MGGRNVERRRGVKETSIQPLLRDMVTRHGYETWLRDLVTRLGYEAWSQPLLRGLVKVQSSAPTVTRLGHEAWKVIYADCNEAWSRGLVTRLGQSSAPTVSILGHEAWTVIYTECLDTWTFILVKGYVVCSEY